MTAKETYKKRRKEIDVLMAEIKKALKRHDLKFKKNETNWGYVGSLGRTKQDLKETLEFIK